MTTYSPAPPVGPPVTAPAVSAPAVAWLVPLAAVVAIVGAVLPWFKPIGYRHRGQQHGELGVTAHAWQGGFVGVIGPVLLVIIGVLVLRRLARKTAGKPGKNPIRRAGLIATLFAVLTFLLQLAARGLVLDGTATVGSKSYKLEEIAALENYSAITRGTQIGFWITSVAAAIALIGGIAMMIAGKRNGPAAMAAATPAPPTYTAPVGPTD